jgi:hypothetical protein
MVAVTVTEVAGTQAYLQPGQAGGVRRGSKVTLGGHEYRVIQATSSFAVVDVGVQHPRERDAGQATIVPEDADKEPELAKPHPLSTWQGAWSEGVSPALSQTPKYVPIGGTERDRRWDVRLSTSVGGVIPLGRGAGISRADVNARIHAEPYRQPIAFDLDVSLQRWFATKLDTRQGDSTRTSLWLREALVGYGSTSGYYAGFGRMRYAATTLGTLDGARAQAPLGAGITVGAFGGVLPNPLNADPSLTGQRFGVEARLSRPELSLRPEAALVVNGSTFDGKLDERRVSGMFGLYPGLSRVGGHFEVSSFDKSNPWKASPVELTAAGLDGSVRVGMFQFGARADVRQPARSRWLASYLPTSWFCRTVPSTAGAPDVCDGSTSLRAVGAVDAGVEVGKLSVTLGGTRITDLGQSGASPDMTGGFLAARVVRIARILRVEASGNLSRASYLDMTSGSVGPGVTLFDEVLDLSAYYRIATLQYRAVNTSYVQNGMGGTLMLFPRAELLFTFQGEGIQGDDAKAVLLFATAMWRPRL